MSRNKLDKLTVAATTRCFSFYQTWAALMRDGPERLE
jgi:hypothetical protein